MSKTGLLWFILAATILVSLGSGGASAYQISSAGLDAAKESALYVDLAGRILAFWIVMLLISYPVAAT